MTTQVIDYAQLLSLRGRAFVVLGTGSGIGGEVCRALTQVGAQVLCVDLSLEVATKTAEIVGGSAMAADITKRSDMTKVFDKAQELFGSAFYGVVDVVGVPVAGLLSEVDDDTYDRQFNLVLRHAWLTISIAGPRLARNGGGSLIFIGSLGAHQYSPKVALYCTAKAALAGLVKMSATEFGPAGVRINVVEPGRIKNSGVHRPSEEAWPKIAAAIPLRRPGEPYEVAGAVLFMASDLSRFVTGATLLVDGGVHNLSPMPTP